MQLIFSSILSMYREIFYLQNHHLCGGEQSFSVFLHSIYIIPPKQINISVQHMLNAPLNFSSPAVHVPHSTSVSPGLPEPF